MNNDKEYKEGFDNGVRVGIVLGAVAFILLALIQYFAG